MTTNNTVINSIMKGYMKYLCAVVLLIGTSVSAWGASCTLKIWDKSAGAYRDWLVIDESFEFENECNYPMAGGYICLTAWTPSPYSGSYPSSDYYYYHDQTFGTRGTPTTLYAVYFYGGVYTSAPDIQVDFNDCTNPSATVSPTSKSVAYEASAFSLTASRSGTGTVTWTSSNTSVASLSSTSATGATVTPGRAGTATITYSVAEKGDYCAGSATCEVTVTAKAPTVSHNTASKVLEVTGKTARTATFVGGVVTNDGGADIAKYGFVVGTTSGVTVSTTGAKKAEWNTSIAVGTKYGSKGVTGLSPNTTYYVRAYAKNASSNTYGYSTAVSFTTLNEYTISYDNNGGSGSISPQKKEEDATAVLNGGASFSKTGYDLSGWNTADDGTGDPYELGDDYTANADATMYAVWTPAEYTITLNDQSATTAASPTSLTATYNASTGLTGTVVTTLPTKTGYTFGGYYTSTGGEGVQIIDADGNVVASANDGGSNTYTDASKNWKYANDLALYAKWTANTILLTLDKNGGDTDGSASVKYDATALEAGITHAVRSEWNLVGYYAEAGTTTKVLESNGAFAASDVTGYITDGKWSRTTSPTTLYAKWSKVTYTITFNMHGHGSVDNQVVESGETAAKPSPDPYVEDYHFLGWFTDNGAGEPTNTEFNFSTTITGNTTIHAKWEEVTYNTSTYKAWCDPDIEITGDIHLTSVNGIAVYSTSTTNNLIHIQSDDLAGVNKLEIKYLDADGGDAEVEKGSSLFRLCNDGISPDNYNVADGSQIDVSASNTCNLSYSISYTPSDYNLTHHYKLQILMKRGLRTVKTVTKDLYGRSLPEEFVIATKGNDNIWYALPNTIVDNNHAITPVRITVNDPSTPSAATYAPTTTVYKGDGRYAANSNRYAVRFTDGVRNNEDKLNHLQISSNTDTHYPWLSYTGSSTNQDWWLKSTDCSAYELNIPTSGATSSYKLGIYSGNMGYFPSVTSGPIYILPITNKIVDNPASVTEWGRRSVILDVDAQDISSAQARIGNGDAETATSFGMTRTSVKNADSKYNYTLNFSSLDFSAHKGELLYVDWLDGESEVVSTSAVTIPWIIASSGVMGTIDGTKGHWDTEVHVLPGVTLEADGTSFGSSTVVVNQLEIYQGATVKVTTGTLTATTLSLRNGWTRAGEKAYGAARLYITPSAGSLTATNVYADWYIDYDQYYPVSVPWKVATSGITYLNTSNAASSSVIKLRYYDGEGRANGTNGNAADGANWIEFTPWPETMEPGVGYAMTARRPTGKAFSIVRMPLTLPSGAWTSGTWTTNGESGYVGEEPSRIHKDEVAVTAWGVEDMTKPRYAVGWNFIAQPYMSIYQGPITHSVGSDYDVEFVNIPDIKFKEYEQYPVGALGQKLLPAGGFFIQTEKTGTLTFGTTNRKASAPSYHNELQNLTTKQKAYIILNGDEDEDMMGLLVSDHYTADYDINGDLEKLMGDGNDLKAYMRYGDMNMAYVAINETLAKEWIPVSVRIPADGEYTFSLHEASIAGELEGVYLIDYQNGDKITNLIEQSYTFSSTAGTINGRFAINAKVGERQTPTGIDAINAGGDINSDKPFKFIYHDKMYILRGGVIYDATGKKVQEINK